MGGIPRPSRGKVAKNLSTQISGPACSHSLLYTEYGILSGPGAVSFIALLFIVLLSYSSVISASIAALAASLIFGTLVTC